MPAALQKINTDPSGVEFVADRTRATELIVAIGVHHGVGTLWLTVNHLDSLAADKANHGTPSWLKIQLVSEELAPSLKKEELASTPATAVELR